MDQCGDTLCRLASSGEQGGTGHEIVDDHVQVCICLGGELTILHQVGHFFAHGVGESLGLGSGGQVFVFILIIQLQGHGIAESLHAEAQGFVGLPALAVVERECGGTVIMVMGMSVIVSMGVAMSVIRLEVGSECIAGEDQCDDDKAANEQGRTFYSRSRRGHEIFWLEFGLKKDQGSGLRRLPRR